MIRLSELDKYIEELLHYIQSVQNEDGSFDTMYRRPVHSPEKSWVKWTSNAPVDTATVLISLLHVNSPIATDIIKKGNRFLINKSLDKQIWGFPNYQKTSVIPFDTESTSECSYVLEKCGYKLRNKKFIDSFITKDNYYCYWIMIRFKNFMSFLSLRTKIKIIWHNQSVHFDRVIAREDDCEFASTCNNLLYIGRNTKNVKVWNEIKKRFYLLDVSCLYYDLFTATYFYARLYNYGHHKDLMPSKEVLDKHKALLSKKLNAAEFTLNNVLFCNTLLFFGQITGNDELFQKCFSDIDAGYYKNVSTYYTGNKAIDGSPELNQVYTLFGSSAITCSLHLEFLNLYRKQIFGKYYGE